MPNRVLLSLLRSVFRVVRRWDQREAVLEPSALRRILLVTATGLGDTLLATPAIQAVREGFPEARIAVLASRAARAVLWNHPGVDEIIAHPGRVDLFYLFQLPRLLRRLRKGRFQAVVILHGTDPDSALLAYLSGAPHRIGWAESRLAFLHTLPVKTRVPGVHTVDIHLRKLEPLGIHAARKPLRLYLSPEEEDWAARFLADHGLADGEPIGVHPFGSKRNKWWPARRVVDFCRRILRERKGSVILFGGTREADAAREVSRAVPGIVNVAGKIGVRASAALMARCGLVVSTDSGPMHMAQALGIPTIALFGPDDPSVTGPLREPYRVIQKPLPCVPCRSKTCHQGTECMHEITAEDVWAALEDMLSPPRSSRGTPRG